MFLYQDVGYPLLNNLVIGLFPSAYSVTSLREYFAVGGMPEAVESYRHQESHKIVQPILQFILDTYKSDFYKYCKKVDQRSLKLLGATFDFIPSNIKTNCKSK